MECSKCTALNAYGSNFCSACGAALPRVCTSCGKQCASGDAFCGACGAALTAADVRSARPSETPAMLTSAERRQVSVMFCDMVDFTPIASRLDPEDLRAVMTHYRECVANTAGKHGGSVAAVFRMGQAPRAPSPRGKPRCLVLR